MEGKADVQFCSYTNAYTRYTRATEDTNKETTRQETARDSHNTIYNV